MYMLVIVINTQQFLLLCTWTILQNPFSFCYYFISLRIKSFPNKIHLVFDLVENCFKLFVNEVWETLKLEKYFVLPFQDIDYEFKSKELLNFYQVYKCVLPVKIWIKKQDMKFAWVKFENRLPYLLYIKILKKMTT